MNLPEQDCYNIACIYPFYWIRDLFLVFISTRISKAEIMIIIIMNRTLFQARIHIKFT